MTIAPVAHGERRISSLKNRYLGNSNWYAHCSLAWRGVGGEPQSDSRVQMPTIWFNRGYRF